jgi:hypothetical protein
MQRIGWIVTLLMDAILGVRWVCPKGSCPAAAGYGTDFLTSKEVGMGHQHSGNYSAKQPMGAQMDELMLTALTSRIRKGKITCKDAHALSRDLGVSAQQVGIAIDLCEARIIACQLGLFSKTRLDVDGSHAFQIPLALKQAIQAALQNDRLACIRAWQISEDQGLNKSQVTKACEAMGIKINQCQLGTF